MANPREIDTPLVDAYLARRALDYLVGFTLSPVLWRKLPGARSAGRVQSVALRLVCDRESEIERFKLGRILADFRASEDGRRDSFTARLTGFDGEKITKMDIQWRARRHDQGRCSRRVVPVDSVEAKPPKRNPAPPFTTSTLQQAASSKLGFAPARTMQVAQKLYEGIDIGGETVGLITYMRTDGVQMAPEGDDRRARRDRQGVSAPLRAGKPRLLDQGQERPGSARGHPPDRFERAPDDLRSRSMPTS
jgi:DNA topoisomerase-1